jgi:iron-regulated transporter 1
MPYVGAWVDRNERLHVYVTALAGENACICLSSALMAVVVLVAADGSREDRTTAPEWTAPLGLLFAVVCALGVVGQVMNKAQAIAVEQDWVVVLSGGAPKVMQTINIELTRIDQTCGVLAPMLFGFAMQFGGPDRVSRCVTGALMVARE